MIRNHPDDQPLARRVFCLSSTLTLIYALTTVCCVGPTLLSDRQSMSVGKHAKGALRHSERLKFWGQGHVIPEKWREREHNYGTDELTRLLSWLGQSLKQSFSHATLAIADLGPIGGGWSEQHASHQSGRDVDILFFMKNDKRRNEIPEQMVPFDNRGIGYVVPETTSDSKDLNTKDTKSIINTTDSPKLDKPELDQREQNQKTSQTTTVERKSEKSKAAESTAEKPAAAEHSAEEKKETEQSAKPEAKYQYDLKKNWGIVRRLIDQQVVPVQWIFASKGLKKLLLDYAERKKESPKLIERATDILHQPSNSAAHDNHFHVRIYCSKDDQRRGCIDAEPMVFAPAGWLDPDYPNPIVSPAVKTFLAAANCSR